MKDGKRMNVLILGSGGREHALAWKTAQSSRLGQLYIAPGNPGTATCGENVPLHLHDHAEIIRFCREKTIDLVLVGPEAPLAEGIADSLTGAGFRCFGPSRAAAQIEASKVFAKHFMARHGIPTARYATFDKLSQALAYLEQIDYLPVIKASGLAAGKGVILPHTRAEAEAIVREMLERRAFGAAGSEVVIEERLTGPEVSLMAFSDGKTVIPMLPAQDHKRIFDGDQGPNTGGMGAYAPSPLLTAEGVREAWETVLQPAVNGLRLEGRPFVGVLYAGLMLTPAGLRVLEFNCRFGDPETQAVLSLLETDLLEIAEACVEGRLSEMEIRWKPGASVCVVLAAKGYPEQPETGQPITMGALPENVVCFHAGTKIDTDGRLVTSGGRVLGVTSYAAHLFDAVNLAYDAVKQITFDGMQYRTDIAARVLKADSSAYAASGVSIDAGNRAVELMKSAVKSTYTPAVLAGIGSFGGLFDASLLKQMQNPVLVASTDGVGTKVKLAAQAGRYRSIGHDIVNHCIDDILVQGARPLFFMDYFATSHLNPEQTAEVVTGMAEACRQAGMALLGGETAEMPGVYQPGAFDVAGTIVGVLEREQMLPRLSALKAGDVLLGLRSSGPHTNGYSLIRKVFADTPLETVFPELGLSLADALLAPHRSYLDVLASVITLPHVKALAHLTGGGFIENIPRILPENLSAVIRLGSWPVPPLWGLIQQKGNIACEEMYRVFNMGIGMVVVVEKQAVNVVQASIPEETFVIGELVPGAHKTILQGL
ncbi:MAG: phosphoribosylamine--glycine ligase [Anaerolineales bacterium]|nr:phosphoribosylamine--glycine ligase [Anaerolineales bacterium]